MANAQYGYFYEVIVNTGQINLSYNSLATPPFTVVSNPTGENELMSWQAGPLTFTSYFSGTDENNNLFIESGVWYLTNTAYQVGDFIPNYATAYALRDTGAYVACFLSDTIISTPGGQVAVQNLVMGDRVLTADGRTVPVKWIGRQRHDALCAG